LFIRPGASRRRPMGRPHPVCTLAARPESAASGTPEPRGQPMAPPRRAVATPGTANGTPAALARAARRTAVQSHIYQAVMTPILRTTKGMPS
jgi:hypothetical protein